ncbi:hypothetical protein [Mulberry dwarf phytoplasma]|uniref:hypothetical protein n=1 Tax=Mulberry dwarf phytoplasma TaxID=186171 RepID=UPI001D103BFE|nr:hypothetical protein [Mulberry dwarf phytoplasma]
MSFFSFYSQVKTNYNLNKNHFFLNHDDVAICNQLLKLMPQTSLEIILDPHLEKNYMSFKWNRKFQEYKK